MLIMTFPDPHLPLAQLTEYKVGKTLGISASFSEDDTCHEPNNAFIEVHDFDATLVRRSYENLVVTVSASLDMVDNSANHLDSFHTSSSCSLPSPSPVCHNMSLFQFYDMLEGNEVECVESLGNFRGYDPSLNPYSLYLGNLPMKIMYTIAFDHSHDFSKAFDKLRRALTIISSFMFKCSYLHSFELHAQVFDKLLQALTALEL